MTAQPDADAVAGEVADAIATVLARHDKSMVTKWVALVESIDPDGRRGLWTLYCEGSTTWDVLGMLAYAAQVEQATLISRD